MDKKVKIKMKMLVGVTLSVIMVFASGCTQKKLVQNTPEPQSSSSATPIASQSATPSPSQASEPSATEPGTLIRTDYENFKPNESGEIPVLMFHKFVKAFEPGMDKSYTTTFDEFAKLLPKLYDQGFRLISMEDFIDCNINVPAGTMPMVFSFDDGTEGQFNLIEDNGTLKANPDSAVGILMEFGKTHPDFGTKGIFYVNMDIGDNTFKGSGSLSDRFNFLLNNGFELGSHTWGHVNFKDVKTQGAITEALGRNQEAALSILPNLNFYSLALPYGGEPKDKAWKASIKEGEYNGTKYDNLSIMAVGANPSPPSISPKYNPEYVPRIRMQGQVAVDQDLTWWLPKMTSSRIFVSDGDPATIVIPSANKDKVDEAKLNGKKLVTY